jgi:hypothetical protein
MTKALIEHIAAIIATSDVRDPLATLSAIDKAIEDCLEKLNTVTDEAIRTEAQRKKTKVVAPHEDKPVFTAKVFNNPDSPGSLKCRVTIWFCEHHIEPRHIVALNSTMMDFCNGAGV